MVFTHCPEKVLRKSGKEKEKWLGEQCEQNSHLRAMYQIVGHKPERVFLVDHEADPKQVRSVYAGLRQRIFDIHEPLKWDHEQLLEKFQLLEKEIERERKQKAEAVEKLEKECRRLQDQVEKAGEDDKATKEKIKKLESEKEQLEINSNKKIQNFENQKKATTAAYSLSNVSKASSGSTGSSSCFGGSCQIQVHGNLRDLVCGAPRCVLLDRLSSFRWPSVFTRVVRLELLAACLLLGCGPDTVGMVTSGGVAAS